MSPISKILGGCRTLMAKAVTNATATGAGVDRRGGIHKIFPVSESLARFVGQSEVSFSTAMEKVEQYTDDHNLWVRDFETLLQFPFILLFFLVISRSFDLILSVGAMYLIYRSLICRIRRI